MIGRDFFKGLYPGDYKYRANFTLPSVVRDKDVHVYIESNDKHKVMDWMQEIMIEYGIDSTQSESIDNGITIWNKGDAILTCNFKIS